MFNNIIYFIIVLLIFSIYPADAPKGSLLYNLGMIFVAWLALAVYCRRTFRRFSRLSQKDGGQESRLAEVYQGLVLRLSILSIFLFALDVYVFHLKYWIHLIPGLKSFSAVQGVLAVTLFILYQCTVWHASHPAYEEVFKTGIARRSFIFSHIRLNVPILFPWFLITLAFDLLLLSPWEGVNQFMNNPSGQLIVFSVFFLVLLIFMPPFVRFWWGCKPLENSEKVRELKAFLEERAFRCRGLLDWPIFEGRMLTAGIMGIIPRYRYILITDSLMKALDTEELKAVTAHEMGHAHYRHMLFYGFFFLAYMVLFFWLVQKYVYLLDSRPYFVEGFVRHDSTALTLYYLTLSVPIMFSMLLYFRYVMGFFMRHFERQADLYSALVMGSPIQTIRSLEKIALLSGRIRELPSWHHFSIRQRVECLWRLLKEPDLVKRQSRFVAICMGVYLMLMIGIGYWVDFGTVKEPLNYRAAANILTEMIEKDPGNVDLYINLAMVYHEIDRYEEAMQVYESALTLDTEQAVVLNNLAWLLVTAPDKGLRDGRRGLELAKRAVALERTSMFLDTLAEAYFVNGLVEEAIRTIEEALQLATERKAYYLRQLERFKENNV
ncbi:MAG: M48 family metalloprotease [Desulfatiglandales bacterium]